MEDKVQKDVDIDRLMENSCKYFDNISEAFDRGYLPLRVFTIIRTAYTNKVVQYRSTELEIPYVYHYSYHKDTSEIPKLVHTGMDLIMYLSSVDIISTVRYHNTEFHEIMRHSKFVPTGLLNNRYSYPAICSQIVLADNTADSYAELLRPEHSLVPISDMHLPVFEDNPTIRAICDLIINVKPEEKEVKKDNE